MLKVTPSSTSHFVQLKGGGKAFNLYLLQKNKINVPAWICLSTDFFEHFIFPISETIKNFLQAYIKGELDAKSASFKIEQTILNHSFSKEIITEITAAFHSLNSQSISVRSSALDEDSGAHSFAGQLSSFLFINSIEGTLESVKKCFASGFSERSLVYRKENKLDLENIKVAVILQKMIKAEKAGVIFTHSPHSPFTKGHKSPVIINSVYGSGEGFVSGLLDPDTYYIEKESKEIISNIVSKPKELNLSSSGSDLFKEQDVPLDKQEISSLREVEIRELFEISLVIENIYQRPQDIEWAISNGQIYILQARPITNQFHFSHGDLYIWDNSNIVESYGGLTLPLTFSFAHFVYHQVYVQFCEILLVPRKHIQKMDYFLKNMLGLIYGRVYYNLLNWYKLTSILPGNKYNRSFMETMMGTSQSLENEIAERIKPGEFHHGFWGKIRVAITGCKFFYFHLTAQQLVNNFLKNFYKEYNLYRTKDYSLMSSHNIYAHYRQLEEKLLWKWHAPIINDFLCMVHYGIFKKLTEKWFSYLGPSFHNDLMAGNGNLESALPTRKLIKLAHTVQQTKGLQDYLEKYPASDRLEALAQSRYVPFYREVEDYIKEYGFRCMSEMKLEQKDMHQDPSLFFIFLNNLLKAGQTDISSFETREKLIKEKAEKELETLSFFKKMIYRFSLHHTRKAVANRENTRFCRTRIYGVVRAMMNGIGQDFSQSSIIDKKEDIFYLHLDEVKGALEGTNSIINLKEVIALRKSEYQLFQNKEVAPRIITRGPVYWHNEFGEEKNEESSSFQYDPDKIQGIGCSPGIIEGICKVILGPEDDLNLNGEILVTLRTDPGWIPLYPSAKGLLVERGGLLSHSAIVAREMGLPTIVGIKGLTQKIKSGMKIRMDGEKGTVEIIE